MKNSYLLLLLLLPFIAFSQKLDLDLVKNLKPRNIGPGGMSGRVTSIDVVESNPMLYMQEPQVVVSGNLKVVASHGNPFLTIKSLLL